MMYNQDLYYLNLGRKATLIAIIGFTIGIIFAFLLSFSKIAIFFTALIFAYIALSSFWGAYNLSKWFKKYRYRMPKYLWYLLNIFIYLAGIIVGLIGYGFIEHFLLVLAIDQQKDNIGLISAQIILIPYLGSKYAKKINY
ncbi:MAG: hypothetical protein ACQERL_06800 [Bacillota bacterium]